MRVVEKRPDCENCGRVKCARGCAQWEEWFKSRWRKVQKIWREAGY